MNRFDSFAVVDWSAANDTGPRPKADAIWAAAVLGGAPQEPVYLRNRPAAVAWVEALIAQEMAAGRRLMVGFDFPFGYPAGFARAVTGKDAPLVLWEWMAGALEDTPRGNNRFELAGRLNRLFPGTGPFWFNGTKRDIADLPRKGRDRSADHGLAERRAVETRVPRSFSCWQMGGAGAVGGQVMTGMAALWPIKARLGEALAIWPFEPLDRPVVFTEIWPSLLDDVVRGSRDPIRDRAQVRILAGALARLDPAQLAAMLAVDAPEEGWILGVGQQDDLAAAAQAPAALRDDCFALPPGVDWVPVDEAVERLRAAVAPVVGVETVAVAAAAGRVLARDAVAARANPPRANAAVDGYGFAHAGLKGRAGPVRLPRLAGRAAAGAPFDGAVPEGAALRILTGAALPEGVDTVVLDEDCTASDTHIAFRMPVKPGANTRKAGEDVAGGDTLLSPGHLLRPPDIGFLAAAGVQAVTCHAALRVGVLSTGDELTDLSAKAGAGDVIDANRPMLLSLLARWGHAPADLGIAPDDRDGVREALMAAARDCDAILTSGGASAGDEDHVSALLRSEGHLSAWRIALKPGRPLLLGTFAGTPVFGLPGNPVAALVCALIFARPALAVLAGGAWDVPAGYWVPAAFGKSKKPGRREYLRARLDADGAAVVFGSEGSGRVSSLSWATGLVELPDRAMQVQPGDRVRFLPYAAFGI